MSQTPTVTAEAGGERLPPRERLLAVASDLFYRHGIRAVGVESIAEAAGTNKMTLYRHFTSKDELVAEYLRRLAAQEDGIWDQLRTAHPDDPRAQLKDWVETIGAALTGSGGRGCALANAAVELPGQEHPARCVIERHKIAQREKLTRLCADAGLSEPDFLADELFLLLEGARVAAQSLGKNGPTARFARMADAIIASHAG
jgi:AcrR family transcriptional regulator